MALQPEVWQDQIVENLYKDNSFLTDGVNADQYVLAGKVVHIPQAGAPSDVVIDRTVLPATVQERTDTEATYALNELTSNPILIKNIDTIQLSYDKRQSVLKNDLKNIGQKAAENMLKRWASNLIGKNIIRTTGAATDAGVSGATGNRKAFAKDMMFKMKLIFDKDDVDAVGRKCLLPPDWIDQLLKDKDLAVNFIQYANLAEGIVGRVAGFDIKMRSSVLRFNSDATVVKDPSSVVAADDNAAGLFWHPDYVERALGDVKMFERLGDPTYFGDIYSFLLMFGGRGRRADGKGVGAVVEAASA